MAKKRKTLPSDFEEIVANGNIEELKAIFDKCDINAYGGYWKGNALTFQGISGEFISWLVENGADVNARDVWGNTPISYQAKGNIDNLKLLLKLGADIEAINNYKCTPLCHVASSHHIIAVKALVENGANVNSLNNDWSLPGKTPLEYALHRCDNINICAMATIADILLRAGATITPDMKTRVLEIGKTFEFYRANFNKEYLKETEEALNQLYERFGVKPVAKRITHDGVSLIQVKSTTWQEQFAELWELLIPGSGHASTVQGEVVRIIGKVSREIMDNGACNWNKEYKKLPQALPDYFAMGHFSDQQEFKEVEALAKSISANCEDEVFTRLRKLAVRWVLLNPKPIALHHVDYER